jgi:hypothetical protein
MENRFIFLPDFAPDFADLYYICRQREKVI